MKTSLRLDILPQPDNVTCGPTCLHAVYKFFRKDSDLDELISQIPSWEGGGTIAVLLGNHALREGFDAKIYTYNLHVFDPSWFPSAPHRFRTKLKAQAIHKKVPKLKWASDAYIDFVKHGGKVLFEDLTASLIRRYLKRQIPILTGLSATYLYRCARETDDSETDDIRGEPSGHFVVLCGYNKKTKTVLIADPLLPNPVSKTQYYEVNIERLICSILLGIVTYDANLLVIEPKEGTPNPLPAQLTLSKDSEKAARRPKKKRKKH